MKPSFLKMTLDDVMKEYDITLPRIRAAPIWVFQRDAIQEMINFVDGLSNEEFLEIKRTVKTPPMVMVRVLNFEVLTMDCRNHPDEKDSTFRSLIHPDLIPGAAKSYSTGEREFVRDAGSLAINCMLMRCLFRDRFVERLTKHQERLIRRAGKLAANEPRIITIAWDAPTPRYTYERLQREEAERRHCCLHEVHSHLRHLRSGKTVLVRGHMRGDPNIERKTIINHTGSKRDG